MEEGRVLLALDFAGDLVDVVSQPLRLRFTTARKSREHTPDFLAVTRSGTWLIDVRPEPLIGKEDRESFAAAAEAAVACGWRYAVAARWREHVLPALDALSSQRRPLADLLGGWTAQLPPPSWLTRSSACARQLIETQPVAADARVFGAGVFAVAILAKDVVLHARHIGYIDAGAKEILGRLLRFGEDGERSLLAGAGFADHQRAADLGPVAVDLGRELSGDGIARAEAAVGGWFHARHLDTA